MSKPRYYMPDELDAFNVETLEIIADARGLDLVGTGADGKIVKADLITVINADQDATGVNPALVAALVEPTAKTYRVGAPGGWDDHPYGSTFTTALDPVREAMLLEGGALVIVPDDDQPKAKKEN